MSILFRRLAPAVIAALAAIALAASAAAAQAPAGPLSVYPTPGTESVGVRTQLSFRGITADQIGTVRVRGTRSGRHAGEIRAHSDGQGASWVPKRSFKQGEQLTVRTTLNLHGAPEGDFTLRVATVPSRLQIPKFPPGFVVPPPVTDPNRFQTFRSRKDLEPPKVFVTEGSQTGRAGLILTGPKGNGQSGPMLFDDRGDLVFFRRLPTRVEPFDVRAQTYRGKPVLTWFEGTQRSGIGFGDFVIADDTYKIIKRFPAANGFVADLHEFLITPRGTALTIAYASIEWDLRPVGGSRRGIVVDSIVQEIDIATGLVTFEWHSLNEIPLTEAKIQPPQPGQRNPWDYVHANSVEEDTDGNLLVSGRSTWAIYKVNRATATLAWRLGGKSSDFQLAPEVVFAWQHDVRRRGDGAITMFDNEAFPPIRAGSRALALRVDEAAKTVTLMSSIIHPRNVSSASQGNLQSLPGGGLLVGYGSQRTFTEFATDGSVVWDATLVPGFDAYRGYRVNWTSGVRGDPDVEAADRRDGSMRVWASWNGQTRVATWEVLGGPRRGALESVATAPKDGFETRIKVPEETRFIAVRALDAAGTVLGRSRTERVR